MTASKYTSVIQRDYTKFFDRREENPMEDLCILVHTNKVCLITLSPNHKALKDGPVQSLNYLVEHKKKAYIQGKRKLQSLKMKRGQPLCEITSGNGTKYIIKCPVVGKLCEINDNLLTDLTLLQKMPETNGYLAIILHYSCPDQDICSFLLTEEQYLNGEVIKISIDEDNIAETPEVGERTETDIAKAVLAEKCASWNEEKGCSNGVQMDENITDVTVNADDEVMNKDEVPTKKPRK